MGTAEAQAEGALLMVIQTPTVMDASGNTVPASLSVDGNTVTMTITPAESTTFPATAAVAVAAASDKAGASKAPKARFGLSDEQKSAFDETEEGRKIEHHFDPRLEVGRLGVKKARLIVNYNTSPHSELLHEWVEAVEKEGLEPYITFRACVPEAPNYGAGKDERMPCPSAPAPTSASFPGYYYNHVLALMRELVNDGVRTFGAWNEPDLHGSPLHNSAKRAAVLWGEAQRAAEHSGCGHHCIVVAGEFAGYKKGYVGSYVGTLLHDAKVGIPTKTKATFWGLHDYNDLEHVREEMHAGKEVIAKNYRNLEARALVSYIKTKRLGSTHIWLSEQGIRIKTTGPKGTTRLTDNGELQRLAAQDFLRLGNPSEHLERVYYYGYRGPSKARVEELANKGKHEFDSALLAGEGFGAEPIDWRPAYCVLALGNNEGCSARATTSSTISSSISSESSAVVVNVYPEGLPTNYWVEYGTTSAYGQSTSSVALPSAQGGQSETATLSGLESCTTYHYQAEAENEANEGTPSLGGDKTFQTGGCIATAISAKSGLITCAVLSVGGVDCWGQNGEGGLGNGTDEDSAMPVQATGITSAIETTVGGGYACALLSGGSIDCWGDNRDGQLGNGTTTDSTTPVAVSGIENATAVTSGSQHVCALLSGGGIDCWGSNEKGELGNGTTENSSTPVSVSGITSAIAISGGEYSSCALLSNGHIDCWGWNLFGELGNGKKTASLTPVPVSGITNATAVATGNVDTCALLSSGHIDCWGYGGHGQLGNGTTTNSSTPVSVSEITNATAVAVGAGSVCALLSGGSIDCWGDNEFGQLGNGTTTNSSTPVSVSVITNATALAAGGINACALLSGGGIDCWGFGESGELGNGMTNDSSTPVPVIGFG
jgi:alpha-tubulin suppressor-like RCC1 family protein